VLQYSEPYGQKLLSQFLGEQEIDRKKHGINRAAEMGQDRLNESDEEKIKKIVLESEFANLEPLEAFIKIGNFPVSKICFAYQEPKAICEPLIRRELGYFDSMEEETIHSKQFVV
ncbi:MAG: type IV secretion system DNA-binding domain-containing protein, partial [Ignavibacteria bacterium]|nr:type IV secretion system DNA-binding domain-containing protein [Ignavibacteria bacterium]